MLEAPYYKKLDNLISKDYSDFLYEYLWVMARHTTFETGELNLELNQEGNPMNIFELYSDLTFDVVLHKLHKRVEKETGLNLIPTYSFARLYGNKAVLYPHIDRPSCEYSISLKLGDNGKGSWPLVMEGAEVHMDAGDGVLYEGMRVKHWRDVCPFEGYKSGHLFLHYVDAGGSFSHYEYDGNDYKKQLFSTTLEEIVGQWNL